MSLLLSQLFVYYRRFLTATRYYAISFDGQNLAQLHDVFIAALDISARLHIARLRQSYIERLVSLPS